MMKQRCLILVALLGLFFSGCASLKQAPAQVARPELKRVTQLDVTTNLPIKSWNARTDSIHQHVTPPVGISFIDAETGEKVHVEGTYKVESYRQTPPSPNESTLRDAKPQSSPVTTH